MKKEPIKIQERATVRKIVEGAIALSKKSKKGTWEDRLAGSHSKSTSPNLPVEMYKESVIE